MLLHKNNDKERISIMLINSLRKVIAHFGSATKVAEALGIPQQSVSDWYRGRSEMPLEFALHLVWMMRGEVDWKDLVSFKIAYRLKNLCLSLKEVAVYPCELIHVLTSRIHVSDNLKPLKNKETFLNINRPPCINEDYTLIFGHESFFIYQEKNKKTIPCWKFSLRSLAEGNYITEDLVKTFLISERAAIGIALEKYIGNRQGQRTDLFEIKQNEYFKQKLRLNLDKVRGRTDVFISNSLGFSSKIQYRQVKKILQYGCSELITDVDQSKISISRAANLTKLSHKEQKNKLKIN
ncbi:Cro/CI family transcriptional regulator [Rickettsiella endosymbiont of Dermanyssus gallinae]|uniref:Cro/CI family transcriptional regulator n=1 Tax=Rickettsiella endosymbiont of Dermanyssus gallinae TaxID=2856608 RepID=UPI001C530141|nr:Cro/CI family transcriptional regulator [Rickettsiella endosymbiont of Dermanyssus gallinae]